MNKRIINPVLDLTLRMRKPKEMHHVSQHTRNTQSSGTLNGASSNNFEKANQSSRSFLADRSRISTKLSSAHSFSRSGSSQTGIDDHVTVKEAENGDLGNKSQF